mgnify:CR=1 FL=1
MRDFISFEAVKEAVISLLPLLATVSIGSAAVKSTVQVPAMLLEAIILKVVASRRNLVDGQFYHGCHVLEGQSAQIVGICHLGIHRAIAAAVIICKRGR